MTVITLVVEHARLTDRVALPVPRCVAPLAVWLRAFCEIAWAHLDCGRHSRKHSDGSSQPRELVRK